ncbi:cytochrome P450 family protein [Nonomuraea sp. NPDC004297]
MTEARLLDPASPHPHADNRRLRAAGPLVPVLAEGVAAWAATRHATLRAVLSHPDLSRDIACWNPDARRAAPPGTPVTNVISDASMLNAEGERHTRLRAPAVQAFSPRRMRALRPHIAAHTRRSLDSLAGLDRSGPVDLRREFAYALPLGVISELLGIPASHRAELHFLTEAVTRVGDGPEDSPALRARIYDLLTEIVAIRRAHPGDDLISGLLRHLTDAELLDTVQLLYIAGHITTVNLITNAAHALLTHPGQLALLRSGTVPWSTAVEETLRWDSPVSYFPMRYPVRDVEIDGVLLRAGDAVLGCHASAGRDHDQYGPRADRFDLTVPPRAHLSFGHGRHFCLGAPLARMEAEIALEALFGAFPRMALAVPPGGLRSVDNLLSNSVGTLPVLLSGR